MDRNECVFVGRVSGAFKESIANNGSPYIWFLLDVVNKANANSTLNNYHQHINIMCFKPKVIKYLKNVGLKGGNTVIIFGFVSTFNSEVHGKNIISNGINANEIYVVKTQNNNDGTKN